MEKYPALYLPQLQQVVSLARFGTEVCVIGRDPEASVPLLDFTCSRRQFSVVAAGGGFQIEPLSQSVPTLRNGEVLAAPAILEHNDQITCGSTIFVFLATEEGGEVRKDRPQAGEKGSPASGRGRRHRPPHYRLNF